MKVRFGNILNCDFNPHVNNIIVHGCNAQGVMGSGIAKQIREKWPNVFERYRSTLANWNEQYMGSKLGQVIYAEPAETTRLMIANAITQEHFGKDGRKYVSYSAIDMAFADIARFAFMNGHHVHFPVIGAGLGGGDWGIISDIIRNRFNEKDYEFYTLWILE